jgi:hypothetical protein
MAPTMLNMPQEFAEALMSLNLVRNGYHVQPQRHVPGRLSAFNDLGDAFELDVRTNRRPALSSNEKVLRAEVTEDGKIIRISPALYDKLLILDQKIDIKPFPRAKR